MRSKNRIKEFERNSPYPYGRFVGSFKNYRDLYLIRFLDKFIFDKKKMPFYNVPDLTGFTVRFLPKKML